MNQNKRLVALSAFFLLAVLYQFAYVPSSRRIEASRALIAKKELEYRKVLSLAGEYRSRAGGGPGGLVAPADFSLFPFVSGLLENHFTRGQIIRVTPVEETALSGRNEYAMAFTIDDVSLESLIVFLEQLERRPFLYFSLFQLSRNTLKPYVVKADIQLVVYRAHSDGKNPSR